MPYAIRNGRVVELWRRHAAGDVLAGYGLGVLPVGSAEQEQRWWLKSKTPDLWFPNVDHYLKVTVDTGWTGITNVAQFNQKVQPLFDGANHLYVKGFAKLTQNISLFPLPVATLPPVQDPNLNLWGASQGDIGISQIRTANVLRGHIFTKQLDRSASVEYWFLNANYDFELQNTSPDLMAIKTGEHFSETRRAGWPAGSWLVSTTCRYCTAVV
jgi:hypothetical protein